MPIHEHCNCSVVPVFDGRATQRVSSRWSVTKDAAESALPEGTLSRLAGEGLALPEVLTVAKDTELGMRLVDEAWKEAA